MDKYKKKRRKEGFGDFVFYISVTISAFIYLKTKNLTYSIIFFVACTILITSLNFFFIYNKRKKILNTGIDIVDKMSGFEFEEWVLQHFIAKFGYKGYVTRGSADYGADVVLKKKNMTIVVQAKRWNQKVGIEAIQQIAAAVKHYRADKAIVITNNFYTRNAKELAESNNIELWDRNKLINVLLEKKEIKNEEVKDTTTNLCPMCNSNLVKRISRTGNSFIGCTNFPSCKYTRNF